MVLVDQNLPEVQQLLWFLENLWFLMILEVLVVPEALMDLLIQLDPEVQKDPVVLDHLVALRLLWVQLGRVVLGYPVDPDHL